MGLGSNLGDRAASLQRARQALAAEPGIRRLRASSLYESAPLLRPDQGPFLNQAVVFETELSPEPLLDRLQAIERQGGRQRAERYGPRPIDLDLLLYGEAWILSERLLLPHPGLMERLFVLLPLLELCPALRHPQSGKRLTQRAKELEGSQEIRRLAVE